MREGGGGCERKIYGLLEQVLQQASHSTAQHRTASHSYDAMMLCCYAMLLLCYAAAMPCLQQARQVNEHVAQEEEHRDDRRDEVERAGRDARGADEHLQRHPYECAHEDAPHL